MKKWLSVVSGIVVAGTALGVVSSVSADHRGNRQIRAWLTGYSEVAGVSTTGRGTFRAEIDEASGVISYTLKYSGLTGAVTQSHLHFGQHHTSGGISVWLCQTTGTPAPAPAAGAMPVPMCAEEVSGQFVAANVIGPAGQGIAAGEFAELLAAIKAGIVYANVHSNLFPAGEIRGQVF
jgi:hypothetical protein